ncbi:MAG: agmatinase [Pseudomonadota bacterium]
MRAFLGSELTPQERDPKTAKYVILPAPLERTVSYGSGTRLGPAAIIEASDQLERFYKGAEPCASGIITEAPIDCETGSLPEIMQRIAARTEAAVRAGRVPVTLGGEHAITYGAVSGVARGLALDQIGIVQIDAHADMRVAYQGEPHSHASVMNLLTEAGHRLAQFGVRALSREEDARRRARNVFFLDAEALVTQSTMQVELPQDFPEHVYVTFDVDGLDPSIMPATGTPVPGGLGYYQALSLIRSALEGRRCVGIDVTELAPVPGSAAWDFTAAQITYALMSMV